MAAKQVYPSFDTQWSNGGLEDDVPFIEEISKKFPNALFRMRIKKVHWKDGSSCSKCRAVFNTLKNPKQHCYHCGDVFCSSCLPYRRSLDRDGRPSRHGISCPVCLKCSEDGGLAQSVGSYTSLLEKFKGLKYALRSISRSSTDRMPSVRFNKSHRDKVIMSQLEHLISNFPQRSSVLMKGVPNWQKSDKWPCQEDAKMCEFCKIKFTSFVSSKYHCRLCGLIHCSKHADKRLLLYTDDKNKSRWALKDWSEPHTDPKDFTWLHCCNRCYDDVKPISQRPVEEEEEKKELGEEKEDEITQSFFKAVTSIQQKLREKQAVVDKFLTYFSEIIDELEEHMNPGSKRSKIENNVRKHFFELTSAFKEMMDLTFALQKLSAKTKRQEILKQNIVQGTKAYHSEFIIPFRMETARLQKLLPDVDKSAKVHEISRDHLSAVHCAIYQIVFELIQLGKQHGHLHEFLVNEIGAHLKNIERIVEEDIEQLSIYSKEPMEIHQQKVEIFVTQELKENRRILPELSSQQAYHVSQASTTILMSVVSHLNWCKSHIARVTATSDAQQTKTIIESKLLKFTSGMQFMKL